MRTELAILFTFKVKKCVQFYSKRRANMVRNYAFALTTALLFTTQASASPEGSYSLTVNTKTAWPISASISGDKITLQSRGRTTVIGSTASKSSKGTKYTGKVNFKTGTCTDKSSVTITLNFTKEGSYKSGSAKGKCIRSGGTRSFRGSVSKN